MQARANSFTSFDRASIPLPDLLNGIRGWLLDGQVRQHSPRTLETRKALLGKLVWWLETEGLEECGPNEIRGFLAYCTTGHLQKGGRWSDAPDNGGKFRAVKRSESPVKPRTIQTYHGHLRTFFDWYATDRCLACSIMANLKPPVVRRDQVHPFTDEQVLALLAAADRSPYRFRDRAIVLFLLDTGLRASELCSLRVGDIDLDGKRCRVVGKGRKERAVFFGGRASHALWMYLRARPGRPTPALNQHVFRAEAGHSTKNGITAYGLGDIIRRLGKMAGITGVRCSPHTFRHTFAVSFLRNGGSEFSLMQILGHTSLAITRQYVEFAQADIERQHRAHSPADRLFAKR